MTKMTKMAKILTGEEEGTLCKKLGKSLSNKQLNMLQKVFDMCINEGATSKNLAPLWCVFGIDWDRKPSKKVLAYAKKLAKSDLVKKTVK